MVVNTVGTEEAVQQQLEADGEFEEPPEGEGSMNNQADEGAAPVQ